MAPNKKTGTVRQTHKDLEQIITALRTNDWDGMNEHLETMLRVFHENLTSGYSPEKEERYSGSTLFSERVTDIVLPADNRFRDVAFKTFNGIERDR